MDAARRSAPVRSNILGWSWAIKSFATGSLGHAVVPRTSAFTKVTAPMSKVSVVTQNAPNFRNLLRLLESTDTSNLINTCFLTLHCTVSFRYILELENFFTTWYDDKRFDWSLNILFLDNRVNTDNFFWSWRCFNCFLKHLAGTISKVIEFHFTHTFKNILWRILCCDAMLEHKRKE